ncbi:MAG: DUF1273 domain-containing protein [Clostridia bacterium]|nr:DUF1273 domain-containing protein [Clostridia bacterium]
MTTIFFTGHRANKLCGWDGSKYEELAGQLVNLVEDLYSKGYDTFITGGAQGIDQLVFWAVNTFKRRNPDKDVRNMVYSPFPGHESMWPKYGTFGQAEYREMLAAADKVKYTLDRKPVTKQKISQALYQRNVGMMHDSDALCAFINDSELSDPNSHSGTKSAVNVAKRFNRKVTYVNYVIDDDGMRITDVK